MKSHKPIPYPTPKIYKIQHIGLIRNVMLRAEESSLIFGYTTWDNLGHNALISMTNQYYLNLDRFYQSPPINRWKSLQSNFSNWCKNFLSISLYFFKIFTSNHFSQNLSNFLKSAKKNQSPDMKVFLNGENVDKFRFFGFLRLVEW